MACNPLSFTRVLGISKVTRRLMFVLGLQSFGEGRITQDINQLFLGQHLGWLPTQVALFQSIYGMGIILGGKYVKQSLETLGSVGHTSMSNASNTLGYLVRAQFESLLGQYAGLLVCLPGGRKRDAVEAIITDQSLANSDMGKGQIAAALSNFRSLATIFGPPMAATTYNWGNARGVAGAPFYQIALLYALAELVHRSMSRAELGLDGDEEKRAPSEASTEQPKEA